MYEYTVKIKDEDDTITMTIYATSVSSALKQLTKLFCMNGNNTEIVVKRANA